MHSCLRDYYSAGSDYLDQAFVTGKGVASADAATYGLTENNTWVVRFSNGVLKGRALCSSTGASTLGIVGNPDESDGQNNCWCRATDFGNTCHVQVSNWVFYDRYYSKNDCMSSCVNQCINRVKWNIDFRQAIFGVTQ